MENKTNKKLGLKRLLLWKSSDVSQAAVQTIVIGFLTLYCTDTLSLNPATVGLLLLISKILDAFIDIFAGWLVDNTNTKWGKGRPYEFAIIGVTICSLLMFATNPSWSEFTKYAWIFMMYTLAFSVFTALRTAAAVPYTVRAFSNDHELVTKVSSYGGVITMLAAIIVNITFPILMTRLATTPGGWTVAVGLFAIPLTFIGLLRFFFVKEDPSIDAGQQENVSIKEIFVMFKTNKYVWLFAVMMLCYNLITSLGIVTYYYKWIFNNPALLSVGSLISIVIMPAMFSFPVIIRKLGSMSKMVSIFCLVGIVGYLISFIANDNFILFMVGSTIAALAGLPLAYYNVLFVMKCCSYNEMKGLPRMDGSAGIMSNFTSKVGSAVGSAVSGALLAFAGYVSGSNVTSQPDSAILMIRTIYSIIPLFALIIIFFCAKQFDKLEKEIPVWEAQKQAK